MEDLTRLTPGGRCPLCYVAMLTPPDGTHQGAFKRYEVGTRCQELHTFLQACGRSGRREVAAMREYLASRGIPYRPIGDGHAQYYAYATRKVYFQEIPDPLLQDGVVFFDPDIGLNAGSDSYMRRVGIDKYLFEGDLCDLATRVGESSVVVVYQHLQRDRNRLWDDIEDRCLRLCAALGAPGASFVTDRDVAFLVTAKYPAARLSAAQRIVGYAHRHGLDSGDLTYRP